MKCNLFIVGIVLLPIISFSILAADSKIYDDGDERDNRQANKKLAPLPVTPILPVPVPMTNMVPAPLPVNNAVPAPLPVNNTVSAPSPVIPILPVPVPMTNMVPAPLPVTNAVPAPSPVDTENSNASESEKFSLVLHDDFTKIASAVGIVENYSGREIMKENGCFQCHAFIRDSKDKNILLDNKRVINYLDKKEEINGHVHIRRFKGSSEDAQKFTNWYLKALTSQGCGKIKLATYPSSMDKRFQADETNFEASKVIDPNYDCRDPKISKSEAKAIMDANRKTRKAFLEEGKGYYSDSKPASGASR